MGQKINAGKFLKFYDKFGIIFILIVEFLIFALASKNFMTSDNLFLVARQVSFTGIAAVGMTMVLLVGEIDISVGSILAFTGCLTATLITKQDVPMGIAILIAMLVSCVFGLTSGVLTAYLQIPSLICTLAMQTIIKGFTYLLTGGSSISGLPDNFKYTGQGFVLGFLPFPVIIMIVMFVLGFILLNKTYIGRRVYAVGGNKEAARLSGIKIKKVVMGTFVASGVTAGIAGVLMAARLGAGQPSIGSDFAMDVLTATVLGGVILQGGKGFVLNVLIGSFIIGILSNGLVMCGVLEYWQWIIKGLVLLFAVAMSNLKTGKQK
ncbi:MAG TPA: ABC transporter permease [Candidatus Pelethocola excrementipullorum]|nr:ABC transporter permease [Candidatus Pelethocola excrementipullorum]